MYVFASDPQALALMRAFEYGGHAGCVRRLPYISLSSGCIPSQHPDEGIAYQLPRETSDERFSHWGASVHPQFNVFPPTCTTPNYCHGGFGGGWAR